MGCRARSLLKGLRCTAPTRRRRALDCDLERQRIIGTVGRGTALIGCTRCRRPPNGEQPHSPSRPASAAVPVSAPPRKGAAQPTPPAQSCPTHSPLRTRWSCSHSLTHSSPALRVFSSRSLCAGSAAHGVPKARVWLIGRKSTARRGAIRIKRASRSIMSELASRILPRRYERRGRRRFPSRWREYR